MVNFHYQLITNELASFSSEQVDAKSIYSFVHLCLSERFYDQAVGIQNGKIKNAAMTASSQWDKFHAPFRARLHTVKRGRYIGAWSSRHNKHNQWLKIDLGRPYKVTGIATQGRQDAAQWVTAYYVYYSLDGMHYSRVTYWWDYIKVSNCENELPRR